MLISFKEILTDAHQRGYAVGAFNCLSLENVLGAIEAAEELSSPIILQLAEVQFPYSPPEMMSRIFLKAARKASVPVAVHLDHGLSFETCIKAMKWGFRSVMFDGAALPTTQNIAITRDVVRVAKAMGIDVEAELGKVGSTGEDDSEGSGLDDTSDVFTDVEESAYYIKETGVDALAVAIGNLHGRYVATPNLNIERLKEINKRNNIPLVLHGGTGTSEADFKACIHNGISKINVATAIQLRVTEKVKAYVSEPKANYIDMKYVIKDASKEVVMEHMELFESINKAK